jgi:molybdopterin-guanine dinucleotide biosynthesis protein A
MVTVSSAARVQDDGISALIMAGGESRRLGMDKALLCRADGTPLLPSIARVLAAVAHEVIVVAGSPERCARLAAVLRLGAALTPLQPASAARVDLRWQPDDGAFLACGPLGGLYSGLRAARGDVVLAVGCDMPFLALPLLRLMVAAMGRNDVVLPIAGGHAQPLHAVYRRDPCLACAERLLRAGRRSLRDLYTDPTLRVAVLDEVTLRGGDPSERSWHGVNTPAELAGAGLRPWPLPYNAQLDRSQAR